MPTDFEDYLVEQGIVGPEQLAEARTLASTNSVKVYDALIQQ